MVGLFMGSLGIGMTNFAGRIGADPVLWFSKIQILLSLLSAVFLFWFGFSKIGITTEPIWLSAASPGRIPGYRKVLKWAIVDKKKAGMFLSGLLMGFLPCGLSFAAFARALSAQGPIQGAFLLLTFSVGTMPGLLLIGAGASGFFKKYRNHSDIISGLLMIGMALSLAADAVSAIF
jgi:sulfite exporter TauE/SafE